MKTTNLVIGFSILFLFSYLISCDVNDITKSNSINKQYTNDNEKLACSASPDRCPIPSSCSNGNGEHFCLYLRDGLTKEDFDCSSIHKVSVSHIGRDCDSNIYICNYSETNGGTSYSLGCKLPWCSDNCSYTRSVCLLTYDNITYTGSVQFSYINYAGVWIDLYESQAFCNFGEEERNDD